MGSWWSSETPRVNVQPRCSVCGRAFVTRIGQLCETCKRKRKTRQHTLDQGRLRSFF